MSALQTTIDTQDIKQFLQHPLPDLKAISRDLWFDNSLIETFLDCPRLSWYNYFHGFESKSPAMSAGTVWHAAIAELHATRDLSKANLALAREYEKHKTILQSGPSRLSFGNVNDAFQQYHSRFGLDAGIEHHVQEFKFAVWYGSCDEGNCLCDPNERYRCFWFVGRFDGICTYNKSDLLVFETKTGGQLSPSTITGFDVSRQATGYCAATEKITRKNGYTGGRVKGALFNVARLTSKVEFARHVAIRRPDQILEWEIETREIVADIRRSWGRADMKPIKNRRACTRYGTCQFLDLCASWEGKDKTHVPGIMSNYKVAGWTPY
jgi:hypothetical protein